MFGTSHYRERLFLSSARNQLDIRGQIGRGRYLEWKTLKQDAGLQGALSSFIYIALEGFRIGVFLEARGENSGKRPDIFATNRKKSQDKEQILSHS